MRRHRKMPSSDIEYECSTILQRAPLRLPAYSFIQRRLDDTRPIMPTTAPRPVASFATTATNVATVAFVDSMTNAPPRDDAVSAPVAQPAIGSNENSKDDTSKDDNDNRKDDNSNDDDDDDDSVACVVCMDAPRSLVITCCGHLCFCHTGPCGRAMTRCPVCRGPYDPAVNLLRVYF